MPHAAPRQGDRPPGVLSFIGADMRFCILSLFMSSALLLGGCGSSSNTGPKVSDGPNTNPDDAKELEQLKGTWLVTKIEVMGNPLPKEAVKKQGIQYVFEGNRVTIHRPGKPDKTGRITVDTTTNPKRMTIDIVPFVRAAYALEDNKLRLCWLIEDKRSENFPAEVASKAGPRTDLYQLERR
jgi:uncharacterized protein (TIGR03067 family)